MSVKSSGRAVRRGGVAVLAVATACLAAAASGHAAAGASAKPGRTAHQSYFYMSCAEARCQRQMYRVPEDRRFEVYALSCAARVATGMVSHIGVKRERAGGGEEVVDIASNLVGVEGDTHYFAMPSGLLSGAVDGGETVNAFIDSTGEIDAFYCLMAGDLTGAQ